MTIPTPDKLVVLWQKGRNYFSTFFVELKQIRDDIGNELVFARWCETHLQISPSILIKVSSVLKEADAMKVREQLAATKLAEQMRKAAEREELAKAKIAERTAREEEKAQAAAEKERLKKERKKNEKSENDQRRYKRKKAEKLVAYAAMAGNNITRFANDSKPTNIIKLPEIELVEKIKTACLRVTTLRVEWIETSLELAAHLYDARGRFSSDNAFGDWLNKNEIAIGAHDRSALINLGSNIEAMRLTLERTESRSYQLIWRDTQLRLEQKGI